MRLPIFISVPHAGTRLVPEFKDMCALDRQELQADYDAGAAAIYGPLQEYAAGFCTSDIARSLVDLNRPPEAIGGDGVIKSRTCRNVPVFRRFPDAAIIRRVLARYYFPYHERLTGGGASAARLGLDCHTMAAVGPPAGPDPGRNRPLLCLSNGGGTCPPEWLNILADCFAAVFHTAAITINIPFRGGHIIRAHAAEMNWLQIEISETEDFSLELKRNCLLEGLHRFCHTVFDRT